jgi:glycosyltransferase involved in cell wall biosynthesis
VGSTVERKNLPLVIQSVARLRADANVYLLQLGGRFSDDQEQLIDRLGLRPVVRRVPWAAESQLRRAYRAADVLLFPSLYEGFGFPLLEAFASGLPVVASSAGGLQEVAGDAAAIVDSRDAAAYVDAVRAIAADPAQREEQVDRARARARSYTWQGTAERTAAVYRELL